MGESTTDEQQLDATSKISKPKNSPVLAPYPALSRRQRAQVWEKLTPVMEAQQELDDAGLKPGDDVPIRFGGLTMKLTADCEDVLRVLAMQPEAFETWVEKAKDDELLELLFWYLQRFKVGEATASSS